MKRLYERERAEEIRRNSDTVQGTVYTEEDFACLPEPVKRHFRLCGYIGKPVIRHADVTWANSAIRLGREKDWTPLDTRQFHAVVNPVRIAYMKAKTIPIQVRDIYRHGEGHVYGKLFGFFPVVNDKGKETSQSALITLFTEVLLIPGYSLQDYIRWQAVDDRTAKARLLHGGIDVSGVFHFDETGRFVRFETEDRYYTEAKGVFTKKRFSAVVDSYKEKAGTVIPQMVRITWHLDDGDYEYFKGEIDGMVFNAEA